jgi:hypothetical protein
MRTPSEIRSLLQESSARLRDGQVGNPREFLRKLRSQLLCDVPADMELSIIEGLAVLDARFDDKAPELLTLGELAPQPD